MYTKNYFLGIFFILLYCLSSAYSSVIINMEETKNMSALLLAFSAFFVCILFFNLLTIWQWKQYWSIVKANKLLVCKVNISTALYWISIFVALKFLSAMVLLAINWGVVTIATVYINRHSINSKTLFYFDFISSLLLAVLLVAIIISSLFHVNSIPQTLLGIAIMIVAGILGAYNNIYCYQLAQHNCTAIDVLRLRFYLVFVVCAILFFTLPTTHFVVTVHALGTLILLAFMSVAIPLFMLQKGLEHITPVSVSFLSSFIPVLSFLIERHEGYVFHAIETLAVILLSLLICVSSIVRPMLSQRH